MRILMVDNHDSFTYNIVNMIRARGVEVDVVDNDTDVSAIETEKYDGLIISPGPGSPLNRRDSGNSVDLLRNGSFSAVLGICFGHQLIGHYMGCEIYRTKNLYHGETDRILNYGGGILENIPDSFEAVRYHSLAISPSSSIIIDGLSGSDGTIMAFHSKDGRYFGLQFHPESHYSKFGDRLIDNFLEVVHERSGTNIRQEPGQE